MEVLKRKNVVIEIVRKVLGRIERLILFNVLERLRIK